MVMEDTGNTLPVMNEWDNPTSLNLVTMHKRQQGMNAFPPPQSAPSSNVRMK